MKLLPFRSAILATFSLLLLPLLSCRQSRWQIPVPAIADCALNGEYFPPPDTEMTGTVSWFARGMETFYALELEAAHEPSLYVCNRSPQPHMFRLLWDRSLSSRPLARLVIEPDKTGTLTVKLLSQDCAYLPQQKVPYKPVCKPKLSQQSTQLNRQQVASAVKLLQTMPWRNTTAQLASDPGTDGADWIFEERNGDRYRYVDFREPSPQAAEFTELVFWTWTHLLTEEEKRTLRSGYYY